MKKDKCPNCNKRKLEKILSASNVKWLEKTNNREWYGCLNCGLTFFQKSIDKSI